MTSAPTRRLELARPMLVDRYRAKIEELVERSGGRVRADIVHERLRALDPGAAVCRQRAHHQPGGPHEPRRPTGPAHGGPTGPGSPSPACVCSSTGCWARLIEGRPTLLFCAWLAWSRFRVVIPTWDRTLGSLLACLDATLRQVGGVHPRMPSPTTQRTITIERIAGVGVRHPEIVAAGGTMASRSPPCAPFDPAKQERFGGDRPGRQGRPRP